MISSVDRDKEETYKSELHQDGTALAQTTTRHLPSIPGSIPVPLSISIVAAVSPATASVTIPCKTWELW